MDKKSCAIFLHQRDLRIQWNPALAAATKENTIVIPLFAYDADYENLGSASKWWLHKSLQSLERDYAALSSQLIIRKRDPLSAIEEIIDSYQVTSVYWNERFEPVFFARAKKIRSLLEERGIAVKTHNGNYLIDPRELLNQSGRPFCVFTPFYKAVQKAYTPQKHTHTDFEACLLYTSEAETVSDM